MSEAPTCLGCKHCEYWEEYGQELHDCKLATVESRQLRQGRITQEEYDMKWAVYLFTIDLALEDQAALRCPQYEELEVHDNG